MVKYSPYFDDGYFIQLPYNIPNGTVVSISITHPATIYVLTRSNRHGRLPSSLPKDGWKEITGLVETSASWKLEYIFSKVYNQLATTSLPVTNGEGTTVLVIAKAHCSGTTRLDNL